jgi:uncharacterized protein YjdB
MKSITNVFSISHGRTFCTICRVLLFISICTVFLTAPSIVQATTYYVSPSGNNGNPGNIKNPFLTIQHGVDVLRAGDTLFVRGGTYVERVYITQSGTESNPLVIMEYPGESAIIDGQGNLPTVDYAAMVTLTGVYTKLDGFEIRNVGTTNHKLGNAVTAIANYCTISNITAHNLWNSGIYIGDYGVVENCTIYDACMENSVVPGAHNNGSGISAARGGDYSKIRYNTVHDVWGEGISAFETTYVTIENNIIYDNWSVNLYVSDATHCTVQCNLIYKTKDMTNGSLVGILLGDETYNPRSSNNKVLNNIVYGCRRNCYVSMNQDNTLIAYNTFMNSTNINCVQINGTSHVNSSFINNLVIQEGPLEAISNYTSSPGMTMNHNHWSKTPDSDAFSSSDIIDVPNISKKGSLEAGELTGDYFILLETSRAINSGKVLNNITRDYFGNLRGDSTDIGANEYINSNNNVLVTNITVTGAGDAKTISTNDGTLPLNTTISPANATNKTVTWSISNGTGQATISSSGLITAIANGTVTAKATANDGSGISGTMIITISNQTVLATGLTITSADNATNITTNGTLQLNTIMLPDNATNKTVTWSIIDGTGQATINSTGLVTAIHNGTITAKAIANDGSGISGTMIITIYDQTVLATGLTIISADNATNITTNGTLQLNTIMLPDNATNKTVTWSIIDGTGHATINSTGLVTAIHNGTVTAKAIANDGSGISGTIIITIYDQTVLATGLTIISADNATKITTNGTLQLNTIMLPDNATNKTVTWSIINGTGQATISSSGLVTAIDVGSVTAKAIANDGSGASGTFTITISNQSYAGTTVYIDPVNTNDPLANGSFYHPLSSWDNVSWKEGYTYLQKRGTETKTDKILIGANEVKLGAYGEGEPPVIASQTNTYLISGFEKSGIRISGLDLKAPDAISCIYLLGNSDDTIVIEHCELKSNAIAIKVVDGSTLVTRYNTIASNDEGIYSTAVSNIIYYNIFKNCNSAIDIESNSSKANIYNNVFFNNEKSVSMSYAELSLYNNIFFMTIPGQIAVKLGTENIESDHNIYFPEQDGFINIDNTSYDNLEYLQKTLKIDMNSFTSDPMFVDMYNDNFTVKANSPAINNGMDLNFGFDFLGSSVPFGNKPDIGIFEFNGKIEREEDLTEESGMIVYPNPSSGKVTIFAEIKKDALTDSKSINRYELKVVDISGKTVFTKRLDNTNSKTFQENIDLTGISRGLYIVVLQMADKIIKEKLILNK